MFQMKSAMGTQKWLSLKEHPSALDCVTELRDMGYRIMAADLRPDTKPIAEVDWASSKVRGLRRSVAPNPQPEVNSDVRLPRTSPPAADPCMP